MCVRGEQVGGVRWVWPGALLTYRLSRQPLRSEALSLNEKHVGTVVHVCATRAPMRLRNLNGERN